MTGPVIASSDWVRAFPEQIRPYVPGRYHVLGTDGFGRSDKRPALRDFFEIDRRWIVVKALKALAEQKLVATERSEEHTSELQSLMRSSYAVFCLKKTTRALWTDTPHLQ